MEDAEYGSNIKKDGEKMRIMGMCDSKKKRKTAGIRSTTTPQLPAHLILYNILSRLPAKSLFRFCCVSKLWDATIGGVEDPGFVSSHLNHGKQNRPILLCLVHEVDENREKHKHRRSSYNFISIPVKFDDPNFFYDCPKLRLCDDYYKFWSIFPGRTAIVGECRGLFCIRSKNNSNGPLEIHNLTTREALLLTRPPTLPPKGYVSYGFGFDDSNKQFKLVELVVGKRCMVYTFGTSNSSWRDVTLTSNLLSPFFNNRYYRYLHRALYSNTALHWFLLFSDTTMILSFDIHHEQFLLIPGPPHYPKNLQPKPQPTTLFFEFRGCLCVGSQDRLDTGDFGIRLFYLKNDPRSHHHLPFHPHWEELTIHAISKIKFGLHPF